jgi:hypothetical protein
MMLMRPGLLCGLVVTGYALMCATPVRAECDPQEVIKLIASDARARAFFGFSVALDGDTLVVGAVHDSHAGRNEAGSAYVFVRAGNGWLQQAKLNPSDAAAGDHFGRSVALLGDTVLVGASGKAAAYVFVRQNGIWFQQAKLTAADGAGHSVALAEDMAVVGEPGRRQAYVFVKPPEGWSDMTETARLTASDGATGDQFGVRVALSGGTILVGAWVADHAGGERAGAAYVFEEPTTGWSDMTETAKLTAADAAPGDHFGISVAVEGDTAVVGAWQRDNVFGVKEGLAYVFVRSGGFWTQQARLTGSDSAVRDGFGHSVALRGDILLIGGDGANAAYVFVKPPTGWRNMTETAKITASDGKPGDAFGSFVALDGDGAAIGAWLTDDACPPENPNCDTGSAYVFELCCLDSDGDGVPDCRDECPDDPLKSEPGACGCGVEDSDPCPDTNGEPSNGEPPNGEPPDPSNGDAADGCGPALCGPGSMPMLPLMLGGLLLMRRVRRRTRQNCIGPSGN